MAIPQAASLDAQLDELNAAAARVRERGGGASNHLHVMLDQFLREQENTPEVICLGFLGPVELAPREA